MTAARCFASLALGVVLAAAALAACSAIDPVPPNPHVLPDPDPFIIIDMDAGFDGSSGEAGP